MSNRLYNRVTALKGLRKENIPLILMWVLYYAWVIVFSTWWTASPLNETFSGTSTRNVLHLANLLSSAVFIFVLKKDKFIITSRIGAAGVIAFMAVYLTIPDPMIRIGAAALTAVCIGCVNISMLFPFVFTLNNTEKLYSVVGSNVLICVLSIFLRSSSNDGVKSINELPVSLILLFISLLPVVFLRKSHIVAPHTTGKISKIPELNEYFPEYSSVNMPKNVYVTLFLNCAVAVLCKGVSIGVLNVNESITGIHIFPWYYAGGLAACVCYFLIYSYADKPFLMTGSILFGSVALGLLLNALVSSSPVLNLFVAVLLGFGGTAGMISMYYIIGVIGNKYANTFYVRLSILVVGLCGGVAGIIVGNFITYSNTSQISLVFSIITAAIIILFLSILPYNSKIHSEESWMKDAGLSDTNSEGPLAVFSKYGLSKRETEVCILLLQSYTMRQISGILSISYNTVNTYCTSLYRKLDINSRSELLLLFVGKENHTH